METEEQIDSSSVAVANLRDCIPALESRRKQGNVRNGLEVCIKGTREFFHECFQYENSTLDRTAGGCRWPNLCEPRKRAHWSKDCLRYQVTVAKNGAQDTQREQDELQDEAKECEKWREKARKERTLFVCNRRCRFLSDLELAMEIGLSRNTGGIREKYATIVQGALRLNTSRAIKIPQSILDYLKSQRIKASTPIRLQGIPTAHEVDLSHACDGVRTEKALEMSRCTFLLDAGQAERYCICNLKTIYTKCLIRLIKIEGKVRTDPTLSCSFYGLRSVLAVFLTSSSTMDVRYHPLPDPLIKINDNWPFGNRT
ncbi:hypothetical protein GG344DRAFT_68945 [Lentinula edodes]|nr:hypothetical protein GG344DRAFT_68945 [Lentinula edodes]